jgi:hypothetical protein
LFVHQSAEHSYLRFILATFFLDRDTSSDDSRFLTFEASLRCGTGNDFSPWSTTNRRFRVEVRRDVGAEAVDVFLLLSAAAALCLPQLTLPVDQGTQIFFFLSTFVWCHHLLLSFALFRRHDILLFDEALELMELGWSRGKKGRTARVGRGPGPRP